MTAPVLAPPLDATALAAGLVAVSEGPFVLVERQGRWTYGAGAAYEVVLDRSGVRVRGDGVAEHVLPLGDDPLQTVAAALSACPVPGWSALGWAAFELCHLIQGRPAMAGDEPLLHLLVPRARVEYGPSGIGLATSDPAELPALAAKVASARPPVARLAPVPVEDPGTRADYQAMVAEAGDAVRSGAFQKVVLSRTVEVAHPVDLAASYETGRRANTPAASFALDLGGYRAAGFSPELVAEVDADGHVVTRPLAGTRPRTGDEAADSRAREELLHDSKEVHEHAISALAAFGEVERVCVPGTTRMGAFMAVRPRGSVYHLASEVTGRLAPGRTSWHALASLFPGVTATGVPKAAACTAISRLEPEPRGLYAGTVLRTDSTGSLEAALVLRTVFQNRGRTWLRAGAGVVGASTPDGEYRESAEKLRSVSRFLVPADTTVKGSR